MNFEALRLNFKEYLLRNAELPEEREEIESGDVSVFEYADEFKEYLSEEYNIDVSNLFQNMQVLNQYEIVDGQLVYHGDEEEVSDETVENQGVDETDVIDETDADEIDTQGEYDPENLMVDMMNELLQNEEFIEILDSDGNGEVDTEEMQGFLNTISSIDGDNSNVSFEDIIGALTQIQEGEFELADEVEETNNDSVDTQSLIQTSNSSSSGGIGAASTTSTKEKTISEMTLEELNGELGKQEYNLSDSQEELQNLINGNTPELLKMQANIDEMYDSYLTALQEVDENMASDLADIKERLDSKEQQINEKDIEISNANQDVFDKQNSYDSAVSKRDNLSSIVSALKSTDTSEMDSDELASYNSKLASAEAALDKAEKSVDEAQTALNDAKENLEELQNAKTTLEEELSEIQEEKTALEEQISASYPQLDELMQNYNNAKADYEETKASAVSEVESEIQTIQATITEIQQAITNKENKADTKEYSITKSSLDADLVEALDAKLGDGFCAKLEEICEEIGCNPEDLIGLMYSESGLNPSAVNSKSGATGLIQFMPGTAEGLGTTTDELKNMSAIEQLDYVEKYLTNSNYFNYDEIDAGTLYSIVFLPGYADQDVLCSKGSAYYDQNSGLDIDGDGQITKSDLEERVKGLYQNVLNAYT